MLMLGISTRPPLPTSIQSGYAGVNAHANNSRTVGEALIGRSTANTRAIGFWPSQPFWLIFALALERRVFRL